MRALIIGCGYVGVPLGKLLATEGHEVWGLRRSAAGDSLLRDHGITPIHADVTDAKQLERLEPRFDVVINLVSSSKGGVDEYRQVYLEGTRNILAWLKRNPPQRFVYTSSTSVFAQEDGSWVNEQSPAQPESATSRILLETERELRASHDRDALSMIILRVSGIYGPERGHLLKQYLRGEAILREGGCSYINMVHVDDLARAIQHLLQAGSPGEIYNVTDNQPVTQAEFFGWLARQLKRPLPPSGPADPARKRGLTNKRVSNEKLKSTGFEFTYPTFREGYTVELARLGVA